MGRQVTARHIAGVTKAVAEQGLNIDAIKRLTGRMPLEEENRATRACIELSVRGTLGDKAVLQKRFMELSNEGVDISFQKDDIFRRSRRLICFDMDSTLIETEVIDELADRAGVGPKCGPLPRAPCGARSTLPRVSRAASPCFGDSTFR